jgi:hypothetical protein
MVPWYDEEIKLAKKDRRKRSGNGGLQKRRQILINLNN